MTDDIGAPGGDATPRPEGSSPAAPGASNAPTPRPAWEAVGHGQWIIAGDEQPDGGYPMMATVHGRGRVREERAALIVRAVNQHEALLNVVAAARRIVPIETTNGHPTVAWVARWQEFKDALAAFDAAGGPNE